MRQISRTCQVHAPNLENFLYRTRPYETWVLPYEDRAESVQKKLGKYPDADEPYVSSPQPWLVPVGFLFLHLLRGLYSSQMDRNNDHSNGGGNLCVCVPQIALSWEHKWFGGPMGGLSEHNNAALDDLAEQLGHR